MQDAGFDAAFPALLRLAHQVAHRVLGEREAAQDVAAETLARALDRWPRLAGHPEPWVATVAGRLAIDAGRRRSTARRHAGLRRPEPPGVVDHAQRLDVHAALAALPRRQREVVVLRFLADRSEAETAAALGLSTGTVKSHSHRGLAALRVTLTPGSADVLRP